MVTGKRLAEILSTVNVEDVARAAGVSVKTIYRLRHQQHSPTLDTVERILAAIAALESSARAVPQADEVRDAA